MANKTFKNLNDLLKYAESQIQSTLKNEVATEVVETMQDHIQSDVYDVYDPRVYERKGYHGGLIDQDNIEVTMQNDNTISVENIRFDGDRDVAAIVESGQGYSFPFEYMGVPRPFTENTRRELEETSKLQDAMIQGLKKRGIETKK